MSYLLNRGADLHPRAMQSSKIVPLQACLLAYRPDVTQLLLDRGADVLVRAVRGFTPLHEAALLDDLALIHLLVDHGAELKSRNDKGQTPLGLAMGRGSEKAAALLRELGAEE